MKPARLAPRIPAWLGLGLLLAGILLASCTTESTGESTKIDWDLSDSLKNYSKVVIALVDADDTSKVLATVHSGKLSNPAGLAGYEVPDSIGTDFAIRIQGYDNRGLLAFQSRTEVTQGKAQPPVRTPQGGLPAFIVKPVPAGLLSVLDVSDGYLVPAFKADIFAYSVDVPFAIPQLSVHASVSDSGSAMTLGGKPLASGDISSPLDLAVGRNEITLEVKAGDGSVKAYRIDVTRKPGNVARLSALSLSAGTLSPAFDSDTLEYTATVPADAETVTVSAVSVDPLAQVASEGEPLDSARGRVVVLAPGGTATVKVNVTSVDSSVRTVYSVDLKRALSTDASLASLLVSGSELSPEFHPDSLSYTAVTAQAQVALLPVARDKGARIKVGANTVASGSLSPVIAAPAAAGATANIEVAVTAADGAVKTYTVKLQRAALVSGLLNIGLATAQGTVTLDSAFRIDRLAYAAKVARVSDKVMVTVTLISTMLGIDGLLAYVNGAQIAVTSSFTSNNLRTIRLDGPLHPGLNILKVVYGEGSYTFRITRELSREADLSQLAVSAGTLKPAFTASVAAYEDTVPNSASTLRITASPKDSLSMVIVKHKRLSLAIARPIAKTADTLPVIKPIYSTLSIDTLQPGVPSNPLNLAVGSNLVEVTVVAEDSTVRKTYSISVHRRASANANLAGLTVNNSSKVPLTLSPEFASKTLSYATSTTSAFVTLTPAAAETGQIILVNGKAVATGTASASITLVSGSNTIKVEVTAPDGTSKVTYTISVARLIIIADPLIAEPLRAEP